MKAPARRLTRALGGCCAALALAACVASNALATPGYRDPSFGRRGVVRLDLDKTSDVVGADIAGDRLRGFAVVTRSADETTCTTGRPGHTAIHFTARRLP